MAKIKENVPYQSLADSLKILEANQSASIEQHRRSTASAERAKLKKEIDARQKVIDNFKERLNLSEPQPGED